MSMNPDRPSGIKSLVQEQAALLLPGALLALALTMPMWRYYRVWTWPPTAIFFELRSVFLYLSDIPALIAVGAWLLTPFRRRTWDLPAWLVAALALLAGLAAVSALWSPEPGLTLYHAARLWLLFALFLVVATTPGAHAPLAWGLLASGAIQAGIALAQFSLQRSLGLTQLGEVVVNPGTSGASVLTVGGVPVLRAYGLTQHPNLLGGILAVIVLVGAGTALSAPAEKTQRAGFAAIALTAICFGGLLLSFSRSAWLGAACGCIVVAALAWLALRGPSRAGISRRSGGALVALLAAIGLLFTLTQWPLLRPRLGLAVEGVEIRSIDERSGLQAAAWTLFGERPWLGVGYGAFTVALWQRQPSAMDAYPIYQPVHVAPLLAATELGLPGSLIWLVLAVGPWATLWRRRRRWPSGDFPAGLALGVIGALTALTVISFFDFYPWLSQQGRLLAWLCWGLFAASAAAPRGAAGIGARIEGAT